jgi:tRNA (adenine-N(1)-)-methyltransferase non-catalytic subunit
MAPPALVAELARARFTSCLLAAPKLHTTQLLDAVLPLLAPSAAFAIFSPWPQPLAEAMSALAGRGAAVMLQLHESWAREYQVLPGRTHPTMSMHGTGGYLLSGIKVSGGAGGGDAGGSGGGGGGSGCRGRGGRGLRGGGGRGAGRPPKRPR